MNENTLELIEKLTAMDEKERNEILEMFAKSAAAVGTQDSDEEKAAGETPEKELIYAEHDEDSCIADDDDYRDDPFTKEDMQVGGVLLAGTSVAAGLLGMALDSKALKTAGVVGTLLGGAIVMANKE